MTEYLKDGRPRLPPNQVVTRKFPVMTAGTPVTAGKDSWSLTLDGEVARPLTLDWQGLTALAQQEFTVDIHCVTRWSKLSILAGEAYRSRPWSIWSGRRRKRLMFRPARTPRTLRLVDLLGDKAFCCYRL